MVKNYSKVNSKDLNGPRKLVIKRILAFSKSYNSTRSKKSKKHTFLED